MTIPRDGNDLSPKRALLCNRENALRVASRIFEDSQRKVSILRTGNPLQPIRVSTDPMPSDRILVEMVA